MSPVITVQPVQIDTGTRDREGMLVFANGLLVAVLVRLADKLHGNARGGWFLEAGFGPCSTIKAPVFADLAGAEDWIRRQLRDKP